MLLLHSWTRRGSGERRRHFRGRKFTINKNRAFTTSATPKVKKPKTREGGGGGPLLKKTDGRDASPK